MIPSGNYHFAGYNPALANTVVQNERKHFRRTRVNTKTPSRKTNGVAISAPQMTFELARELFNSISTIVTTDQIKNVSMEFDKQQVKVILTSVEAAAKVIESLNNTVVQDQKVSAFADIAQSVLASP